MSALDPGADTPNSLDPAAQDRSVDAEMEDRDSLRQPSRWWFASTACPLLAGTFGPLASAFNICALAARWRLLVPPGATGLEGARSLPDPAWSVVRAWAGGQPCVRADSADACRCSTPSPSWRRSWATRRCC